MFTEIKTLVSLEVNKDNLYWQLDFGSKLSNVSLLCSPIALNTIRL